MILKKYLTGCALVVSVLTCSHSLEPIDDGVTTIGIYTDDGAAQSCIIAAQNMFRWMGYEIDHLDAEKINYQEIRHIDLFYFPGGSSRPYCEDITETGKDKIRQLISGGSGYIGTCAGAMFAAETQVWRDTAYSSTQLGIFSGTAKGPIPEIFDSPGVGMCQIDLFKSHMITDSEPDSVWILYYNGPYFTPKAGVSVDTIGLYDITNTIALLGYTYGKGRVFLTGPHPEWEEDSDRDSISYFDNYDDCGSDWPLMYNATRWCLYENK